MLTWILGLWSNPLARKCIIYGAAGLGILFALRIYGNAQWSKGMDEGGRKSQIEMEKQYRVKWAEAQKQIDSQRRLLEEAAKANEDNRHILEARSAEVTRARQAIGLAITAALEKVEAATAAGYNRADAVPDAELAGAIRSLSGQLERERTASGPAPK